MLMHLKKNVVIALLAIAALGLPNQVEAYRIAVKNELDGIVVVNITEGAVARSVPVRPGASYSYNTKMCFIVSITVAGGKAVGQMGGVGSGAMPYCDDYQMIARFMSSPAWDPVTGKENLELTLMELFPMQ